MTWCRGQGATIGLTFILLSGLYMRTANLTAVQHFDQDQGRDYLAVMQWIEEGRWPLVGPWRSVTRDFTIGPGWFYTLTPALAVSGYHPAAGATTIAVFALLGNALAFAWVARTSGSKLAGLAVAALLTWSFKWTECQREVWNPYLLPFGMTAIALLVHSARARPVPLPLYLMLVAILPHWHTTGWALVIVSLPFMLVALWTGRRALWATPAKKRVGWLAAVLAWVILLYLPPILEQLGPGAGNMGRYFGNLSGDTTGERLEPLVGAKQMTNIIAIYNLGWEATWDSIWPVVGSLPLVLAVVAALRQSLREGLMGELISIAFLIALIGAFWIEISFMGARFHDRYVIAVAAAPVLLAGWSAGVLLKSSSWLRWVSGAALVCFLLSSAAIQLPRAWSIQRGSIWHGQRFASTQRLVEWIRTDTAGRSFSVVGADGGAAHLHYLLWRAGVRPANAGHSEIPTADREFGEMLYVVSTQPSGSGIKVESLGNRQQVEGFTVYRVLRSNVGEQPGLLRVGPAEPPSGDEDHYESNNSLPPEIGSKTP
jgi:hypothetical protein